MSKTFDLSDYCEKTRLEKENLEAATKEAVAVFRKHFPDADKVHLSAPVVLAACLEEFDIEDSKDAGQLYFEWLAEHYVGRKVQANLEDIETLGDILKDKGFTEDDPFEFGTDHKVFRIPHEDKLVFCIKSQSLRYIYIFEESPTSLSGMNASLSIRRYYDEYDFDGEKDKWTLKDEAKYTRGGIRKAIAESSHLAERYSDCVDGAEYPQRPSLQYFKDRDFEPDRARHDIGYVLDSHGILRQPRANNALYYYRDVWMAFSLLRYMFREVTQ
jgi:hypothetical protein